MHSKTEAKLNLNNKWYLIDHVTPLKMTFALLNMQAAREGWVDCRRHNFLTFVVPLKVPLRSWDLAGSHQNKFMLAQNFARFFPRYLFIFYKCMHIHSSSLVYSTEGGTRSDARFCSFHVNSTGRWAILLLLSSQASNKMLGKLLKANVQNLYTLRSTAGDA